MEKEFKDPIGNLYEDEQNHVFIKPYSSDVEGIRIPEGVEIIKERAFYGYKKLHRIILPDSLQEIGNEAFAGCSELRKISIPKSVRKIASLHDVFRDCDNLHTIYAFNEHLFEIPQSVADLDSAFYSKIEIKYYSNFDYLMLALSESNGHLATAFQLSEEYKQKTKEANCKCNDIDSAIKSQQDDDVRLVNEFWYGVIEKIITEFVKAHPEHQGEIPIDGFFINQNNIRYGESYFYKGNPITSDVKDEVFSSALYKQYEMIPGVRILPGISVTHFIKDFVAGASRYKNIELLNCKPLSLTDFMSFIPGISYENEEDFPLRPEDKYEGIVILNNYNHLQRDVAAMSKSFAYRNSAIGTFRMPEDWARYAILDSLTNDDKLEYISPSDYWGGIRIVWSSQFVAKYEDWRNWAVQRNDNNASSNVKPYIVEFFDAVLDITNTPKDTKKWYELLHEPEQLVALDIWDILVKCYKKINAF